MDGDYQRDGLRLGGFVKMENLLDAVVFEDEILFMQAVNGVAVLIANQGRNRDEVGLSCEAWLFLGGRAGENQ